MGSVLGTAGSKSSVVKGLSVDFAPVISSLVEAQLTELANLSFLGNCEEELPKNLLAVCWPTVGCLLPNCRPTDG